MWPLLLRTALKELSTRSDVFYLNLALGIRLATEMREVISECFGWSNWPHGVMLTEAYLPRAESEPESRLISSSGKSGALKNLRTEPIHDINHWSCSWKGEVVLTELLSDAMEKSVRCVLPCWKFYRSLDMETVFLKREEDTLALHKRFSTRAGEGAAVISQRIDNVRKEAMKVR